MRTSALAVVALVAAALGATAVLVVGAAAGWIADDGGTRTVVVPTVATETGAERTAARPRRRCSGTASTPPRIYASRSQGVVTIYSYFRGRPARAGLRLRRLGRGPRAHELARGHERR